jgi:hypothetical protein
VIQNGYRNLNRVKIPYTFRQLKAAVMERRRAAPRVDADARPATAASGRPVFAVLISHDGGSVLESTDGIKVALGKSTGASAFLSRAP